MKPPHHPTLGWKEWREAIAAQMDRAGSVGTGSKPADQEDIHQFRAALKGARGLLRLSPPSIGLQAGTIRKEIATIARTLARIRDQHVGMETLSTFSKTNKTAPSGELSVKATAALMAARMRLAHLRLPLSDLPMPNEKPSVLLKAIKHGQKRLNKRLPEDWETADVAAIHAYRSALVAHECQMKFLSTQTGRPGKAKLEKLGKLRRYLGEFNDIARLLAADNKKSLRSQFEDWDAILSRAKKRQTALRQKLKKRL